MNVLDAAHHVVNDYPGGAQSLAPRMGKAASSLSHETTGSGTAKLGLLDAVKITQLTGDNRILHAYAQACNALVIPLAAPNSDTPDHVFERMAQVAKEFSDVITAVSHAAADGRVTGNELATVEREWGELVQVGASLMGMLQAMHAAGVPKGMAV